MKPYYERDGIRIFCGDCREILPGLPDASAEMILTDPPYGHGNQDGDLGASLNEYRLLPNIPIANDRGGEEYNRMMDGFLSESARIMARDSAIAVFCAGGGPTTTFAWLADRMNREGLKFFHALVWDKGNPGLGWRYRRQYELVLVGRKQDGTLAWADTGLAVPNVIYCSPCRERRHPNQKPLEIVAKLMRWHTRPGDLVVDPFMGCGTVLRAAKDLGRRAIGIETELDYVKIAVERLRQEVLPLSVEQVEQRQTPSQLSVFGGMAASAERDKVGIEMGILQPRKVTDRE